MFAQYFGGTIMLSIAKSVFENELPSELATYAPSVNPEAVINAGSTGIQDVVTPAELSGTLFAYSKSLMLTMVCFLFSCLAFSKPRSPVRGCYETYEPVMY